MIREIVGVDPAALVPLPVLVGGDDERVLGLLGRLGYRDVDQDVVLEDWEPERTGHAGLAERITATIPAARIVRLTARPVLGAALICLDRLNGGLRDPRIQIQLRAAIESWSATARVVTSS
jgi:hypothetical protein